jgi:Fe2+ or Zn2+ uptake regulation protein
MTELATRGVRMTEQRRLLVGIIQDSLPHLDAAALLVLVNGEGPNR